MFNIDFNTYRIVDLSYEVIPPGSEERPFEITKGYLADRAYKHDVKTHSHVGTHVEAPAHFLDGGKDTTQLPLTSFMGRAILLDVESVAENPEISPGFLEEAIGDLIRDGDIVICRNSDEASKTSGNLPCLTPDAALWFREHKIKMLGIDSFFSLGKDIRAGRALHDILMSDDVILIEGLDNLEELGKSEFFFMALPYKVKMMDSSWARAIAVE